MAVRIDGKALAAKVKRRAAEEAGKLSRKPGLAVVLVGEDPASQVYVAGKERDCAECGIESFGYRLPAETTEAELLDLVRRLNEDPRVDGILVQLPLPGHLNEETVINAIAPDKDVDCFHPFNVGRMVIGDPVFLPCTPAGVMEMLDAYQISIRGKRCVVLGRSNIVGKPMAAPSPSATPGRRIWPAAPGRRTSWSPPWGGRGFSPATWSRRAPWSSMWP